MYQFGAGLLFGNPIAGGNNGTPNFPQRFGTLQDVSVEITQKLVQLRGQSRFPDDIAPGDMEIKGKAAFGRIDVDVYNALFFADTVTASTSRVIVDAEAQTIANNKVTATNANNFVADMGVRYANNGKPLQQVASGQEAAGKYSVGSNNGVYTFSGETNNSVLISYIYTSTSGRTLSVTNRVLGYGPIFEMYLAQNYQSGGNGMRLYQCRCAKMSGPMKRDGYMISDFEFEAFPNAAGTVFDWYQTSV